MGHRRNVVVSDLLVASAQRAFPPGGSPRGTPSYEQFESGPLVAAKEFFARRFDDAPEGLAGTGIKVWLTIDLPFFPPLAFYAVLDTRDGVELVDVTIEDPQDYWAMIESDPS